MNKKVNLTWLVQSKEGNYLAAKSYLSLLFDEKMVAKYINKLRKASTSDFKAKDIFRASGLSLLGVSNSHVEVDRKKIISGQALSPILLVRDTKNGKVIIADGYHRICAVYSYNEDALVPCKIV